MSGEKKIQQNGPESNDVSQNKKAKLGPGNELNFSSNEKNIIKKKEVPSKSSAKNSNDCNSPKQDTKSGFVFGSAFKNNATFATLQSQKVDFSAHDESKCEVEKSEEKLFIQEKTNCKREVVDQEVSDEEQKNILWSGRCKLYEFKGEWKEKGIGVCKLIEKDRSILTNQDDNIVRIIMRNEGTLRLILNMWLFQGLIWSCVGERSIRFSAIEDNAKMKHYILKFKNNKECRLMMLEFATFCGDSKNPIFESKEKEHIQDLNSKTSNLPPSKFRTTLSPKKYNLSEKESIVSDDLTCKSSKKIPEMKTAANSDKDKVEEQSDCKQ